MVGVLLRVATQDAIMHLELPVVSTDSGAEKYWRDRLNSLVAVSHKINQGG